LKKDNLLREEHLKMLKLKQLQERQKQQSAAASAPTTSTTSTTSTSETEPTDSSATPVAAAPSSSSSLSSSSSSVSSSSSSAPPGGYVLKRQSSKELQEIRKSKSKENVFTLRTSGKRHGGKKASAALLRVQKDMSEMEPIPGTELQLVDDNNLMTFNVICRPSEGLYTGAEFKFVVNVPQSYPYDAPKVTCETLIYHPNIDWEGHVCLNILRADWKPVLNLGSVLFGLLTLFLEPNPEDPLNKEAAQLMIDKPKEFERNVKQSLRGGSVMGRNFPRLI